MAKRKLVGLFIFFWAIAVAFGFHALLTYKGRAGAAGKTPDTWPVNALIAPSTARPQLVMFAHPRCPCTKASLGELELLMAQAHGKFDAVVLFSEPDNEPEAWSNTPTVHLARSIPGVRTVLDKNGSLARQFGVETSGHTVVYGTDGTLLFSGGITGSRGHLGENNGFDSVLQVVSGHSLEARYATAKVFGCELFDPCTANPNPTAARN